MNYYLDRLKPGEHLIIAIPIVKKYPYEDFDHIRPYGPLGIEMIFGPTGVKLQYASRNTIKLIDLKHKKKYFYRFTNIRELYLKTPKRIFILYLGMLSAILFKLSGGILGKKDGWIRLYQKVL